MGRRRGVRRWSLAPFGLAARALTPQAPTCEGFPYGNSNCRSREHRVDARQDSDGSDLTAAQPRVLGDRAFYTWRNDKSLFQPGRLDWLVCSGATLRAANAFVLDTARLADGVLERVGLRRNDSLCSDHLPVVVDVANR